MPHHFRTQLLECSFFFFLPLFIILFFISYYFPFQEFRSLPPPLLRATFGNSSSSVTSILTSWEERFVFVSICRHNLFIWTGIYAVGSVRVTPYLREQATRSIYATDNFFARICSCCNIAFKIQARFATGQLDNVATDSWRFFESLA